MPGKLEMDGDCYDLEPLAKASVGRIASGLSRHIAQDIQTCGNIAWELQTHQNIAWETETHQNLAKDSEKDDHLCNCSSFIPLTSPASLLIMSRGMLRSTWVEAGHSISSCQISLEWGAEFPNNMESYTSVDHPRTFFAAKN